MSDKNIFGIAALFNSPDAILAAAKKVAERGYKNWDVHTPYPVHGMDDAMNLKPSKLPWVSLGLQLFATSFAIFFMWIIMAVVYPLVIGGKPMFSLTNFSPVIVAFSILTTVVGTVIVVFLFFCKLPRNNHEIHDTDYAKATCSNKYGVLIEANNEGFDAEEVKAFLTQLGGQVSEIAPLNTEEKFELGFFKPKSFSPIFNLILILGIIGTAAGTYFTFNSVLYDRVPLIHKPLFGHQFVLYRDTSVDNAKEEWRLAPLSKEDSAKGIVKAALSPYTWMDVQARENPQVKSKFFADGVSMRAHPEGTLARGFKPYAYVGQPDKAAAELVNPVPLTAENLKRGQEMFNVYCSMCHGNFADGDGRLKGQFPNPPSLHTEKWQTAKDGLIYHIITEGQNIMPAYDKQISRDDRWRIVNYIRSLQRAKNAKDTDLK